MSPKLNPKPFDPGHTASLAKALADDFETKEAVNDLVYVLAYAQSGANYAAARTFAWTCFNERIEYLLQQNTIRLNRADKPAPEDEL